MSNEWTSTTHYMVPIKEYILVEEQSIEKMNATVSQLVAQGYRPHGSPTMGTPDGMADYYLQGMILYEKQEIECFLQEELV